MPSIYEKQPLKKYVLKMLMESAWVISREPRAHEIHVHFPWSFFNTCAMGISFFQLTHAPYYTKTAELRHERAARAAAHADGGSAAPRTARE